MPGRPVGATAAGSVAIHVRHHRHHEGTGAGRRGRGCSTSWSRVWPAWSTGATTPPDWPWWAPPPPTACGASGRPTAPVRSTTWPSGPRTRRRTLGGHRPHPVGHPRPADRGQRPSPHGLPRASWPSSTTASSRTTSSCPTASSPTATTSSRRPTPRSWPTSSSPIWPPDPDDGLAGAVRAALAEVRGAFALAVVHTSEPDVIVAARRVSPLIMGVTDGAAFLASDIPAILGLTHDFFILDDDRVAELRPGVDLGHHPRGRAGGADPAPRRLGPRRRPQGRLRRLHGQGDARAAQGRGRHAARPAAARRHPGPRRGPPHQRGVPGHHQGVRGGLRLELPRRPHGQVRHRALGPPARGDRHLASSGTGTRWSTSTPWSSG